jgi:uncharacterized phiE125 gp8 family phage protein
MSLKVVTPPTLTTVVATADLRTHLRLASDGTEDGLATTYLAAAHAAAEHYAGRPIGSQTLELALDAFPEGEIALTPAVSAAAESAPTVKYTDLAGVEQTVSATDYSLSTYGLICTVVPDYGFVWPTPQDVLNAVRIRFVAGDVPAAAKSAILLMARWLYDNPGSESAGDDIQPPAAKSLLNTVKVWAL